MATRAEIAELLTQTRWVSAVARSLAGDAHLAEELAQDVWVAALERPPHTDRSVRGWLATVLRHRWRDVRRERSRREERERIGSRPEIVPGADELVERASMQRQLVGAVLELDEPYRSTVLMRFFEGLPQREIARRMNTTTATVNSRLTRALEKLRERLSRHGGSSSWLHVIVPLLREPSVAPTVAIGVAMKSLIVPVVAVASLVGGLVWWNSSTSDGVAAHLPPAGALESARAPLDIDAGELSRSIEVATSERALAIESSERAATPAAATAAPTRTLRGRVLNADGVPRSGVALALGSRSGASRANGQCTSGAGGWFEIEGADGAETIVCTDARFETVLAGSARVDEPTTPTVVVAPRIRVAGIVVDAERQPLAGVWVELRAPRGFGAEWGLVLDYSIPRRWVASTGTDGRFELAAAPSFAGATLDASLGGFAPHREPAPQADAFALEIVLQRPSRADGIVHGVVIDPHGQPVEGAYVSDGEDSSLSDRNGEFAVDITHGYSRIVALKRGFLPAELKPEASGNWPDHVVLQLSGEPGRAAGRVVDHAGRAIAGAKVWIDNGTFFGFVSELRRVVEPLLAGDDRFWSFVVTGSNGEFEIGGLLLDRDYRLRAVDPRTLARTPLTPARAGERDLVLRLATDQLYEHVAGRVVTRRGEPLAGIRVRLMRETFAIEHDGGRDNDTQESEAIVTKDDGSFEFRDVPPDDVWVIASGDSILGEGLDLSHVRDPLALEIVVSLRVHVQVELAEPVDRADTVGFLSEDGRTAYASIMRVGGSHMSATFPLVGGRSEVLAIEERTTTLVLFRDQAEVARVPLHVAAGEVNVIRY